MQTARGNEHKLLAFFTMSEAAFSASGHGKDKWWNVLGVPKPAGLSANSVTTVKTLRALFSTYDCLWREGTGWRCRSALMSTRSPPSLPRTR